MFNQEAEATKTASSTGHGLNFVQLVISDADSSFLCLSGCLLYIMEAFLWHKEKAQGEDANAQTFATTRFREIA